MIGVHPDVLRVVISTFASPVDRVAQALQVFSVPMFPMPELPGADGWSRAIDDATGALVASLSMRPIPRGAVEAAMARLGEILGEHGVQGGGVEARTAAATGVEDAGRTG